MDKPTSARLKTPARSPAGYFDFEIDEDQEDPHMLARSPDGYFDFDVDEDLEDLPAYETQGYATQRTPSRSPAGYFGTFDTDEDLEDPRRAVYAHWEGEAKENGRRQAHRSAPLSATRSPVFQVSYDNQDNGSPLQLETCQMISQTSMALESLRREARYGELRLSAEFNQLKKQLQDQSKGTNF